MRAVEAKARTARASKGSDTMNARQLASSLGLALLTSCASAHPPTTSVDARSGSRLRAWRLDAGDGASRFDGWHDAALDMDCTFIPTAEGPWRCRDVAFAEIVYRDAACTDPIVVWGRTPRSTSAQYVYDYDTTPRTCALGALGGIENLAPIVGAHRIGAPLAAPPQVFRAGAGTCAPYVPSPIFGTPAYAELGEAVALDHFVGADEQASPHGALEVIELVADDGATQRLEVRGALGEACTATRFEDAWRCAPIEQGLAQGTEYADAACSIRTVLGATGPDCAPPRLLSSTSCGHGAIRPLERVSGPLYSSASGTCLSTGSSPAAAWAVGDPLAGDALEAAAPALTMTPVGGALALQRFDAPDGAPVALGEWLDPEGESCRLYAAGGAWVCLRPLFARTYFSDASCSTPLATVATDCPGAAPNAVVDLETGALFTPGAAYAGDTFTRGASGCTAAPSHPSVFEIGPPLDTSELPRVVRTLD